MLKGIASPIIPLLENEKRESAKVIQLQNTGGEDCLQAISG